MADFGTDPVSFHHIINKEILKTNKKEIAPIVSYFHYEIKGSQEDAQVYVPKCFNKYHLGPRCKMYTRGQISFSTFFT